MRRTEARSALSLIQGQPPKAHAIRFADTCNHSESFFYNWSELTLTPVEWFRFGLATQRTRAYKSERDIQRGALAGVSYRRVNVTGYIFYPDLDKSSFVFAAEVNFQQPCGAVWQSRFFGQKHCDSSIGTQKFSARALKFSE